MKNLQKHTDEELVAMYVSGENEAFDTLLERHKDRIYNHIYYVVRNADMADDLFQETFVKAIMTIRQGRYHESGKFASWLMRIAHNLVIDQFRVEQNVNIISNDESDYDLFSTLDLSDSSKESELINEQTLTDVRLLMDELPESQREVVYMRFYQDMSFKEISETMGISINTALGRMRYALINMRKMAQSRNISLNIV